MNFVIEFYRSRDTEEATLDKVSLEAPTLRAALQCATALFHSLSMPQTPDRLRISDEHGSELLCRTRRWGVSCLGSHVWISPAAQPQAPCDVERAQPYAGVP
ncbi:hypothetical protein, partial [Mesorhizobium sp. M1C.F.Ca.ET.195.01.1.1]